MARLPKSIIKKYGITKKAWRIFRGRRKSPTRRTRRRSSNPGRKRGGRRMVRRYRRKRRGGGGKSIQRTAFKLIRIGALAAPAIYEATRTDIDMQQKIRSIFARYTGFDMVTGRFEGKYLAMGWGPFLLACVTTYGIPKLTSIIRRL